MSTYLTPDGLRWRCSGCAACCRSGFELGPIERQTLDHLIASDIEALWPPAGRAPWHRLEQTPTGPVGYLAQRDGACVFLRDDDRCAIHALLGPQAKPSMCQEFPYQLVSEPRGTVAVIRPACAGLHRAWRTADPVGPELPEIEALPRPDRPIRTFRPERVPVVPGLEVPLERWLQLEDELLAALAATPDAQPAAAVATLRRVLSVTEGIALPLPPDPDRAATLAVQAVLLALEHVLGQVLHDTTAGPGGPPPERRAFARDAHALIHAARGGIALPMQPLPEPLQGYTHLLLRSHLLAKGWARWGSVAQGVGHFLLGVMFAAYHSESDDTFARVHRRWLLLSDNKLISAILHKASPALRDLFLYAS